MYSIRAPHKVRVEPHKQAGKKPAGGETGMWVN